MAFAVEDFRDLVRLLELHPEWRAELRRLVLTDELVSLPDLIRELADGQRRLVEAQERTETRLEALADGQRRLFEAQERTESRLEALAQARERTETRLEALAEAQRVMAEIFGTVRGEVGEFSGLTLEIRYQMRPQVYVGQLVRRAHALTDEEIQALLDPALADGRISLQEADKVTLADVVVRGRRHEDGREVYLVIEVSWTVHATDVERAIERAGPLAKTGVATLAVVAGRRLNMEANQVAQAANVPWLVYRSRS